MQRGKKIVALLLLLVLSINLFACGVIDGNTSDRDAYKNTTLHRTDESTTKQNVTTKYEEATENKVKVGTPLSESELLEIMEATANYKMESYKYVDMDHDGDAELIGTYPDEDNIYQTWYCSSDGKECDLIHQNIEGMDECEISLLEFDNATHVVLWTYRTLGTGENSTVIGLENRGIKIYFSNMFGAIYMTEDGDIMLNNSGYDSAYDMDSDMNYVRSFNESYIVFDEGSYKEFGLTQITEEEYLQFGNANYLRNRIIEDNKDYYNSLEFTYFIRANGMIHAQIAGESDGTISYKYYTFKMKNNTLPDGIGEGVSGQIKDHITDLDVIYLDMDAKDNINKNIEEETIEVKRKEIPDRDIWIAESLANGLEGSKPSLYKIFVENSNDEEQDTVYRMMGQDLLDHNKVQIGTNMLWSMYFNDEYKNHAENIQKYIYETIIMGYLLYDAESEEGQSEWIKTQQNALQKTGNAILDEAKKAFNSKKANKALKEIEKDIAEGSLAPLKTMALEDAKQYAENAKILEDIGDGIELAEMTFGTVEEFLTQISQYMAIRDTNEKMIALLKEAKKAGKDNEDFVQAVNEIVSVINTADFSGVIKNTLDTGVKKVIIKTIWDKLSEDNPVLKGIDLTATAFDVLFNNTAQMSNSLKLVFLYTVDSYMKEGVSNAYTDYILNKNAENARKFYACFWAYSHFQMYGNTYVDTWLEAYLNAGLLSSNIFNTKKDTAKWCLDLSKSQVERRKKRISSMEQYGSVYTAKYLDNDFFEWCGVNE